MSVRPSSLTTLTASDLRLAELVAALSIATDLGSGQPIGHGQRASVIAARLGQSAGVSEVERRDAYYLARFRNEKIVEFWHQEDVMSLMRQLGVLPVPAGSVG
jgi:hypothetical protein